MMLTISSILLMCAASLVAPKNGEEQRWSVNLSNSRITDTLKLSFKEDSISHFTVSESLVSEPNYHVQSQYVYRSDSGMVWRITNLKCDSTGLTDPSICRTLDSIPTAAFSFILLGDLNGSKGQCSLPSNCYEHNWRTNEWHSSFGKWFDTTTVNGAKIVISRYSWAYGGMYYSQDQNPETSVATSFLGDSICQSASYTYTYFTHHTCYPCNEELTHTITLLAAQKIDVQNTAAGIAASSRAIHASTSLVFHDMQAFQTWKDAQGGTSVSAIGVNGEKATEQHGTRQVFVRSQGRVYRVLILGD